MFAPPPPDAHKSVPLNKGLGVKNGGGHLIVVLATYTILLIILWLDPRRIHYQKPEIFWQISTHRF